MIESNEQPISEVDKATSDLFAAQDLAEKELIESKGNTRILWLKDKYYSEAQLYFSQSNAPKNTPPDVYDNDENLLYYYFQFTGLDHEVLIQQLIADTAIRLVKNDPRWMDYKFEHDISTDQTTLISLLRLDSEFIDPADFGLSYAEAETYGQELISYVLYHSNIEALNIIGGSDMISFQAYYKVALRVPGRTFTLCNITSDIEAKELNHSINLHNRHLIEYSDLRVFRCRIFEHILDLTIQGYEIMGCVRI